MKFSVLKFTGALLIGLALAGCTGADEPVSPSEAAIIVATPAPTVTPTVTPLQESPVNDSAGNSALNSLSTETPESQSPEFGNQEAASSGSPSPNETALDAPSEQSQVWVNTKSGVYHYPGTRWYGNTKEGDYMSESEALSSGHRAAANGQ